MDRRPVTRTRRPFSADFSILSATKVHALTSTKKASSFQSRTEGSFDAFQLRFTTIETRAVFLPDGVYRMSGSLVILPVRTTWLRSFILMPQVQGWVQMLAQLLERVQLPVQLQLLVQPRLLERAQG